ncbi:hypothetical protein PF005_g8292 [Phytophthora fragariae]|uniref:Uncharacterized protein n=1 Tax=Phytophthora fragariae TaxID=53985 RepID=A0A6A3J1U1_9STRA|nr:hypothetical protein PF003_g23571 [Phytophthora fragariae]KAE8942606.1 hypothetical protein PF009_g7645 [Phytophthora fragariae]KAE8989166.1 hypothetical protein PF011_g18885 [Phytophthora fragariae]KAE9116984.1 hypothetical protein PF006_g18923 [Phytophthora fragariae]KAE9119500.1 hypothetical protein PF007_g8512 [Phytophthora fragariae]
MERSVNFRVCCACFVAQLAVTFSLHNVSQLDMLKCNLVVVNGKERSAGVIIDIGYCSGNV